MLACSRLCKRCNIIVNLRFALLGAKDVRNRNGGGGGGGRDTPGKKLGLERVRGSLPKTVTLFKAKICDLYLLPHQKFDLLFKT